MARDQALSGWTMLTVLEMRQKYKTVLTVDGGHTTVITARTSPSVACRPMVR